MKVFPAIRVEGGLFAPDLFDQLLSGELPGQRPRDFGLEASAKLTDEIAAAFAEAENFWRSFQRRLEKLPESDLATTLTRDSWMIPFLGLLDYRLSYVRKAYELGGMTFAISHRAGEGEYDPPVHIVGFRQELGRVAESGRPRLAPHSLVQEFLNRSEAVWGLVTNGRVLRLLRDSTYIRRQCYVEFDLQAIFEQRLFEDFSILFRLLHRTRLPRTAAEGTSCFLEQYYQHTLEQGGRVRDRLRDGVEEALRILANGFLRHPHNQQLRQRLSALPADNDRLSPEAFYQQLLRLVYRFLFLLVSEDRGLISGEALYLQHYGVSRFRRLVDRLSARTEHTDLWQSLQVLWKILADDRPVPQLGDRTLASVLGLPVLNGQLFEPLDLDQCLLTNQDLLDALWHLINYQDSPTSPPRRVNYAALDVEELGSVYESLLDFHPQINTHGGSPEFTLSAGSERKSTGSYYTPHELVTELVRSALEPVVEERLAEARRMEEEWKQVANGELPTEKGERVARGEQRVEQIGRTANSEWRVVCHFIVNSCGDDYGHAILSRLESVAKCHGFGRAGLSGDSSIPAGGNLRPDNTDAPRRNIDSGEHCGGMGTSGEKGVSSIPAYPIGQSAGVRDVSPSCPTSDLAAPGASSASVAGDHHGQSSTHQSSPESSQELAAWWSSLPFATRHSLLARVLAETAILSLRVLDPACGSGHFLLAAARYLGKRLARIRTGEDEPAPEHVREAIRDVVAHCIYGVDKNPLAVELCRVALWIESHTPGRPLTFLDHRIKCGDSLVGVFDLGVLKTGIPGEAFEPLTGDDKQLARQIKKDNQSALRDLETGQLILEFNHDGTMASLAEQARQLSDIPDDSPEAIRRKKEMHNQLCQKMEDARLACDLWTAAFFQEFPSGQPRQSFITTETLRQWLERKTAHPQALARARMLSQRLRFFHWPLEFPEVFLASGEGGGEEGRLASGEWRERTGGFDVVLSNPPFLGGLKISGTYGPHYRHWLELIYDPFGGTADLCSAFYRRAFQMLSPGGRLGMVATNTIAQGDTRESGLKVIVAQGGQITFARRFVKWPGAANVEVNLVAIHKPGQSRVMARHSPALDSLEVPFISSRLDTEPESEPKPLAQNQGKAFQGDIVRGMGFVLEPDEAEHLLDKDPRNANCLFPYLNGEDLNGDPEQRPSRWVICFHDWPLDRAKKYRDLLRIIEERVKPERERLRGPGDARNRKFWWQFAAYRSGMRQAIAPLRRVLVRSRVSELHALIFVPRGWIYSDRLVVFAFEDDYHFSLLQSTFHEVWVWRNASTLESRNLYTPTDCFDTFAFPADEYRLIRQKNWNTNKLPAPFDQAASVGADYHEHRRQIMRARQLGLTKTYNLFHDPDCQDADIARLRQLHVAMDEAILTCYGWQDLKLDHNFYQNDRSQTRFTVSPAARRELLFRLLELNHKIASGV